MFGITLRRSVGIEEVRQEIAATVGADYEKRIEHLKKALETVTEQRDANAGTITELRAKLAQYEEAEDEVDNEDDDAVSPEAVLDCVEEAIEILNSVHSDMSMNRTSLARDRVSETLEVLYRTGVNA